MFKRVLIGLSVLNLLALDGYVIYELISAQSNKSIIENAPATEDPVDEIVKDSACGEECMRYIDEKVDSLVSIRTEATPTVTKAPAAVNVKERNIHYVPIPGNGSTLLTDWTSIPSTDFYLDIGEYPGVVESYLEVNMKLTNGNGYAYIRLYDATHGIAVVGSEVKTSSQTSQAVISGKINLWAGKNLYKIQAKSLTADTTVYEGGRLKIITEN